MAVPTIDVFLYATQVFAALALWTVLYEQQLRQRRLTMRALLSLVTLVSLSLGWAKLFAIASPLR